MGQGIYIGNLIREGLNESELCGGLSDRDYAFAVTVRERIGEKNLLDDSDYRFLYMGFCWGYDAAAPADS